MIQSPLALVSHPLCPFVQRAAIALLEKGVSFDRIDIDLTAKPEWFLAISPTGKVPLLKIPQESGPDAVLFESMVICEYLEETQEGVKLYSADPLERARQRAWIEFGTATLTDAWLFLNAKDAATAAIKHAAFREKLERLEGVLEQGPYFGGATFSMVDAVFSPVFRYFDILEPEVSTSLFDGLNRVSAWKGALMERASVLSSVGDDYPERFRKHLREHGALLAA